MLRAGRWSLHPRRLPGLPLADVCPSPDEYIGRSPEGIRGRLGSGPAPAPGNHMSTIALTVIHRRRLRDIWRSAGWPCQDMVEVELLAAGWLERVRSESGHETLRVTDA